MQRRDRIANHDGGVELVPEAPPAIRYQVAADPVDSASGGMGMPLAPNEAKVRHAIQSLAISQYLPMEIGRVNAIDIGMTIQDGREP